VIVSVQTHHGEELVFSELEAAELDELREWFCYTKPMGPSIKIVATPASAERAGFCVVATGTETGYVERLKPSGYRPRAVSEMT
jgi:hypothetical protein